MALPEKMSVIHAVSLEANAAQKAWRCYQIKKQKLQRVGAR